MRPTRRAFLKASVFASTGLMIRLEMPIAATGQRAVVFEPNAYIRITPDNIVHLWITRSEMGQGVRTTLAMMLNEELEADWAQIRYEQAMPGGRFKGIRLRTSGSGSTVGTYAALRKAGATAREMLIAAAGQKWNVEPSACRAEQGKVIHVPSGKKCSYGELSEAAAVQKVPANPSLKNPGDFRVIGKRRVKTDGADIVAGQATFGLDVHVPGMLYSVMARCPYMGGKVASFDASKALAISGVRHVVRISSGIHPGVAVVADCTWAAIKGRDALHTEWDPGPNADFDSDRFLKQMEDALVQPQDGYFVRGDGDVAKAMTSATKTLRAEYVFPFQAHAPLETMNCVADVRANSCEIWVPTQAPEIAQSSAAKMLGIPEGLRESPHHAAGRRFRAQTLCRLRARGS